MQTSKLGYQKFMIFQGFHIILYKLYMIFKFSEKFFVFTIMFRTGSQNFRQAFFRGSLSDRCALKAELSFEILS